MHCDPEQTKSVLKRTLAILEAQGSSRVHLYSVLSALEQAVREHAENVREVLRFDALVVLSEATGGSIQDLERKLSDSNLTLEQVRKMFALGLRD